MTRILHLDASARPGFAGQDLHGSHSRQLGRHFIERWLQLRPQDAVSYRDIGQNPPSFIDHEWIAAAFTAEEQREPWMHEALAESDRLVDELVAADVLVIGTPLYNFGMPAALKAWVDQVIRAGRTVAIDTSNPSAPYLPLLADRPRHAVILSARGGIGFDEGGELAHMNHLEPNLTTALGFIGITRSHRIAIEGQEFGGELLARSVEQARGRVEALVAQLQHELHGQRQAQPA